MNDLVLTATKVMLLTARITDCQTRRKAAIMRAATACREV